MSLGRKPIDLCSHNYSQISSYERVGQSSVTNFVCSLCGQGSPESSMQGRWYSEIVQHQDKFKHYDKEALWVGFMLAIGRYDLANQVSYMKFGHPLSA